MSKIKTHNGLLPHGAASRIAHNQPLTATQFYQIGPDKLKLIRQLRNQTIAKEVAQLNKNIQDKNQTPSEVSQ